MQSATQCTEPLIMLFCMRSSLPAHNEDCMEDILVIYVSTGALGPKRVNGFFK